jgi:hypothetical protein
MSQRERIRTSALVLPEHALLARLSYTLMKMVGAAGFEPATSCAQGRRATRLRYAPMMSRRRVELLLAD